MGTQLERALHVRVHNFKRKGAQNFFGPHGFIPCRLLALQADSLACVGSSLGKELAFSGEMGGPGSPFSRSPFSWGCAVTSLAAAAVDLPGFSGGASGFPMSGPHPKTGVPSRTWSSLMAGTGVPLLVHFCIRRSRACLRLSCATASLLTAAAALASACTAQIYCSLTASSACSARWVCSLSKLACLSKS